MKHLYACACDAAGGVYHYVLQNGTLSFCDRLPLDRPMYMVIEGKKAYILLREIDGETHEGGLVVCDLAADGGLTNVRPPVSTGGVVPCHLCVDGETAYVANYLSGSVAKIPGGLVTHEGQGVDASRQEAPHTHFVGKAPDGYILCCDLGLDTVFTYDRSLKEVARATVPAGQGARHLAFSADGKWVYCVNEMGNTVTVFSYSDGRLERRKTYAPPGDFSGSTAAAIRLATRPEGNSLYISHRGADCVSRFGVEGERLEFLESIPCGGHSPRDIISDGEFVLCANEQTDDVTALRVVGGKLMSVGTMATLKHPLCLCVAEL